MATSEQTALEIFRAALDLAPMERAAFVADRCAGELALCVRVTALLAEVERQEVEDEACANASDPLVGARLGPFRVRERIGRGGMGVVYRGEREGADFRQQVAIKLIRRGFDFDDVERRFLRERRILARLDHPNLARFIDGGVAPDGRPWFALEHVRGRAIDAWCDEQRLPIRSRVRLFLDVCAAVQYAHAQLVVHRDLKPANVLVDETGRARLLDFGIAALLVDDDAAPDVTHTCSRGALTPEYAAPEQLDGAAIGTATDVYALGVMLYRLLAGVSPYDVDRHDSAALERAIRGEPPRLLTQAPVRGGREALNRRMEARATHLDAWRRAVRGDLRRIVEKALAKEPERRYVTVAAMREDLQHWLDGRPVRVSGDGIAYRLSKLVQRHRAGSALAALALLAIAGGFYGTLSQMREARLQRNDALVAARRSDAVRDYLMLLFRDAAAQKDASRVDVRKVFRDGAARLLDQFGGDVGASQTAALMLSDLFLQVADLDGAEPLLERLTATADGAIDPDLLARARYNLAQLELTRGDVGRARELLDAAQAAWIGRTGSVALQLNESRLAQARLERVERTPAHAVATLEAAIAERRRLLHGVDYELGNQLNGLAIALSEDGRYAEAMQRAEQGIEVFRTLGRADSDGALGAMNNRCSAGVMLGRNAECLEHFRRVAEDTRRLYGESVKLAAALHNVGVTLTRMQRPAEALAPLEEASRVAREQTGERSPVTLTISIALAEALALRGDVERAAPLLARATEIVEADYPQNAYLFAVAHRARAQLHWAQGEVPAGRVELEQATERFRGMGRRGEAFIRLMAPLREALDGA